MDIKTIEDEIYQFDEEFFEDASALIEDGNNFIEDNFLYTPKENYTAVADFLNHTLENFRRMDTGFMTPTLEKLKNDIKILHSLHISTKKKSKDIKEIFNKHFLPNSMPFKVLEKEILTLRGIVNKSSEDKEFLKLTIDDFRDLHTVYYETFYHIFYEDRRYYLNSILVILNSVVYYYDKLLWKEANKSKFITHRYRSKKDSSILNTRDFLIHTTDMMQPYTREYEYLRSCIRIYK